MLSLQTRSIKGLNEKFGPKLNISMCHHEPDVQTLLKCVVMGNRQLWDLLRFRVPAPDHSAQNRPVSFSVEMEPRRRLQLLELQLLPDQVRRTAMLFGWYMRLQRERRYHHHHLLGAALGIL